MAITLNVVVVLVVTLEKHINDLLSSVLSHITLATRVSSFALHYISLSACPSKTLEIIGRCLHGMQLVPTDNIPVDNSWKQFRPEWRPSDIISQVPVVMETAAMETSAVYFEVCSAVVEALHLVHWTTQLASTTTLILLCWWHSAWKRLSFQTTSDDQLINWIVDW